MPRAPDAVGVSVLSLAIPPCFPDPRKHKANGRVHESFFQDLRILENKGGHKTFFSLEIVLMTLDNNFGTFGRKCKQPQVHYYNILALIPELSPRDSRRGERRLGVAEVVYVSRVTFPQK